MSTRAQQAQLLSNSLFQQQVTGSLLAAAAQILNEAATTADHVNRLAWARAIFANPQAQMQFFIPGMLTNATVAGEAGVTVMTSSGTPVLDSDCDYVVASLFNTYADQYALQQSTGALLKLGS